MRYLPRDLRTIQSEVIMIWQWKRGSSPAQGLSSYLTTVKPLVTDADLVSMHHLNVLAMPNNDSSNPPLGITG